MPMICDRCGKSSSKWKMSYFNEDKLCPDCQAKERAHPKYHEALRAEHEQVLAGNYNFPGIGKPDDL